MHSLSLTDAHTLTLIVVRLVTRYIPAVVDHSGGLPCHGTYLLHQVLNIPPHLCLTSASPLLLTKSDSLYYLNELSALQVKRDMRLERELYCWV